ncbi:protein kinase [Streptomyces sp. NPDC005395]|uniref:protein kinase n=1 Tax=Streptomyces sp. NPDC005395 TaxID=3157042 RepID=UPI0033B92F3B
MGHVPGSQEPSTASAQPADRERFDREARTWIGLGLHPQICACHYVRAGDEFPRVFAEYVKGGSLGDQMRGEDPAPYPGEKSAVLARIVDIAVQTAWGLEHAHPHHAVDRDVKPGNILVGDDGQVRGTDFVLAQATLAHRGPRATAHRNRPPVPRRAPPRACGASRPPRWTTAGSPAREYVCGPVEGHSLR